MTFPASNRFIITSFAWTVVALAAAPSHAQLPLAATQTASEINSANQLMRDGKIDEAIEAYRKMKPDRQHRDEWNYNLAVAEYRKGNLEAAEKYFSEVAGTDSAPIAASSQYNLGNCQYSKALQAAGHDTSAAIRLLRQAISNYRSALRGNSDNSDARANIELAGEFIRQLQDQEKQENEKKDQDNQNQQDQEQKQGQNDQSQKSDSKDATSDQQKEEQQQQDEGRQTDEQQQKDGEENKSEQPSQGEEKSDTQKSAADESQSEQRSQSEPQTSPNDADSKDSRKENPQKLSQQSDDSQTPDEDGKTDEFEKEAKTVPEGDLTTSGEQDETEKSKRAVGMADPNTKDGLMTREEALKMLQSVRDRDMLRRMQQQRKERSRHVPVDRDW